MHQNQCPKRNGNEVSELDRDSETQRYGDTETQRHGDTQDVTACGDPGEQETLTWQRLAEQSISINEEHPGWQSRTWQFVRHLKALPQFEHLSADKAYRKIPWDQTEFDKDDRLVFLKEWNKVKVPLGRESPLRQAQQLADDQPLFKYDSFPRFARFLSITAWLQRIVGDGNDFFFSTRDMAAAIGAKSPETISSYISMAVSEKLLRITKRYPRGSRHATRYRFDLDQVPGLKDNDI